MDAASNMLRFPLPTAETWIKDYTQTALSSRDQGTIEAYTRFLPSIGFVEVGSEASRRQGNKIRSGHVLGTV